MTMLSKDEEFKTLFGPPAYLDGAKVIKWAWSGQIPFGFVCSTVNFKKIEIYGLAICQYEDSKSIYRFSCDKNWVVIQDSNHDSIITAVDQLPDQYKNGVPNWQTK